MAYEIAPNLYERTRPLFRGRNLELLIDAVILGNSPARVWVDDPEEPRSVFLWDRAHCYFLAGDASNAEFNSGVAAVVAGQIARQGLFLKIGYASDAWEEWIPTMFRGASPVKRDRFMCVLERIGVPRWQASVPSGFRVEPIDASLLGTGGGAATRKRVPGLRWVPGGRPGHPQGVPLQHRDAVADEIGSCWPSIERFLAHGFGYSVLREEEIVCWCTAEYVSEGKCGIGIETISECQGRGLATIAASAFVEYATSRRIIPHWDCWKGNQPSLAVARKVGFEPVMEYSVYVGRT